MLGEYSAHQLMPPFDHSVIARSSGSAQREHAPITFSMVLPQLPEEYQGNRQGSSGREREGEAPRQEIDVSFLCLYRIDQNRVIQGKQSLAVGAGCRRTLPPAAQANCILASIPLPPPA